MFDAVLVDAGPLVALLHREDRDHEPCLEVFKQLREPMLTTWMPMTEAMYLLEFSPPAQGALLEMVERDAIRVLPIESGDLPAIRGLMHQYADLPMDFADATLVHVANRENVRIVFTLDRRDFSVYRLSRRRSLTIIPS